MDGSNQQSSDLSLEETSSPDINKHLTLLNKFRITDLQTLLGAFGCSKSGRKFELLQRATDLLMDTSIEFPGFSHQAYLDKIIMIYYLVHNTNMMQNQQPRICQPQQMAQDKFSQAGGLLVNNNTQSNSYQHFYSDNVVSPVLIQPLLEIPSLQAISSENNNSFNIFSQYLANLTFKKLQFYEVQSVILKPSLLIGQGRCSLLNKGLMKRTYTFVLKIEDAHYMSLNRNISTKQKDYDYQVQIRIGQLEATTTEIDDYLPFKLDIQINGSTCALPPIPNTFPGTVIKRIPKPIDCSNLIKLTPNSSNSIIINWAPDEKEYVVAIYVVKKFTSNYLFKKLLNKEARHFDETKNYIINKLINMDPDLATTSYCFSLMCPLGKMRMNVPAKSIKCDHLQCFDAMIYILMNEKKSTWECPICQKPCLYDDIQIESYFWEVIKDPALTDSCEEIELLADGSWRMYEEKKTAENLKNTSDIDFVILDDSDG